MNKVGILATLQARTGKEANVCFEKHERGD
jgi:hypothetical protein